MYDVKLQGVTSGEEIGAVGGDWREKEVLLCRNYKMMEKR